MQTLLPTRDQFPIQASPLRDPVPVKSQRTQPDAKPYSQFVKDQQELELSKTSQKTPAKQTSSINELQESKAEPISQHEIDAQVQSENTTESQSLTDKLADNSDPLGNESLNADSRKPQILQKPQAQEQSDSAQSQPAESAEIKHDDTNVEFQVQANIEYSSQEDSDFVILPQAENIDKAPSSANAPVIDIDISSNAVEEEPEIQVNSSPNASYAEPEVPVNNDLPPILPAEPSNSAAESTDGKQTSDIEAGRSAKTNENAPIQSHKSSQAVKTEDNVKTNHTQQGQSPQQPVDNNIDSTNQIDNKGVNEKQEPIAAQHGEQQDTSAANNARVEDRPVNQGNVQLEDQPVRPEPRPAAQSNSQTNTQTNSQANQALRVGNGQDQQQSSTQDQSSSSYSEPKSDESKVKSTSNQRANSNLPQIQEATTSQSAASARASQVDAAIRLENATGQPVEIQVQAKPAAQVASGSLSVSNSGEGQALNMPTSSADPLKDPAHARILRGLTATINQRGGSLTMRLDPPELGQLRIQMSIVRGIVTANFQVQTTQAQALLERSLATLKTALQGQGLTVERLTVQTTPQTQTARYESEQQTSQQRQQHDASQGESKGRRDEQSQHSMSNNFKLVANEYKVFDLQPQPAGAD